MNELKDQTFAICDFQPKTFHVEPDSAKKRNERRFYEEFDKERKERKEQEKRNALIKQNEPGASKECVTEKCDGAGSGMEICKSSVIVPEKATLTNEYRNDTTVDEKNKKSEELGQTDIP